MFENEKKCLILEGGGGFNFNYVFIVKVGKML